MSLWLSLEFFGCDGAPPLQLAPVESEGANRRGSTQMFEMPQGVAEAEVWVGPTEDLFADLLSLTVMVRGREDQRLSLGVEDAFGRVLIDAAQPEFSPNRALSGVGLVMAQLPTAQAALPLSPPFKVRVARQGDLAAETLILRLWTKHPRVLGTVPSAQELQIQVINAGGVVEALQLERALERARQIWRQAGVELFEDLRTGLDSHLQPELAHVVIDPAKGSDSPSLKTLLQLSSLALGKGLPLFLVEDIKLEGASSTQGQLWAISGGVPVPPVEGTARSGLAVSAALLKQDPQFAGQIIAHEIGHALGLFHSTEATLLPSPSGAPDMAIHDGLSDTPACPAEADADQDKILSSGECGPFDAQNLMFWGTPRGAVFISPAQADVARRSVLTR